MEEGLISWLISWAAWLSPFIFLYWLLSSDNQNKRKSPYSNPGWHFRLKRLWAYITISRVKAQRAEKIARIRASQPKYHLPPSHYEEELEQPRQLAKQDHIDSMLLWAADFNGSALIVRFTRMRHCQARIAIQLNLKDGTVYQLPQSPDTFVSTTSRGWSAGGLHLEVIEPLSKWRVLFNGLLRKGQRREWSEESAEELHHVRFNFIWTACSVPYICRHDWSASLLADTLAREPWRSGDWMDTIKSHVGGYDQWGTMLGQVNGLPGSEDILTLHLRGLRQRRWGSNEAGRLHRRLALTGVLRTGAMFSVGADCEPGELSHATYGHVRSPDGHVYPVDWTSLSLPHLAETPTDIPRQFVVRFRANKHTYSAAFYLPGCSGCLLYVGRPWNYQMTLEPMECALDTKPGIGLAELCYRYNGPCPLGRSPNVQFVREPAIRKCQHLVLGFSERECQSSALVGGKGASLAALSSLEHKKFCITNGFCLTVEALKQQLSENPSLTTAIDKVNAVASTRLPGDLEQVCTDAVRLLEETPVCDNVRREIISALKEGRRWAVRSSAVGEDSEDLSAAGQNATILGCRDAEHVIRAVARCWASLYTYQSVSYRKQNGQHIVAEMGVVVQQMVDADTAGVLFTCDPTNGDPRRIHITSNYGLGESVVSASVEPDTIIVRPGNPYQVIERNCGKKAHKVVMDDEGTTEQELGAESNRVSLDDQQAIDLAEIGKQLEINFGGPRDIEWAFAKGILYLLQVRPVTSLFPWTDFELRHERDSPLIIDNEVLTRANTGEVCPGACPTLGSSLIIRILDYQIGYGFFGEDVPHHYCSHVVLNHNQVFVNVINTFLKTNSGKIEASHIANDIGVFGHRALDDNLLKAGIERFGSFGPLQTGLLFLKMLKDAYKAKGRTEAATKLSQNFSLRGQYISSAEAMLKSILESLPVLHESVWHHCAASRVSSFGQVMVMTVLVEGKNDVLPDHCADMAVLMKLTATGTVSSEVPEFITATSTTLLKHPDFKTFQNLPTKDALTWLEKNTPEEYTKLQEFLSKHGHRVLREVDIRTVTYDMDCLPLIEIIQAVVRTRSNGNVPPQTENVLQKGKSPKEVIDTLKTPQKKLTRQILRLMLPWYQNTVKIRETSKAAFIQVIHEFRLAFRHLGKLLVQEGILPDTDLLYFLSIWELGQIIKTRNPNLLRKAIRRQRLYPQWDNYQFPELNYGIPKPQQEEEEELIGDGVSLKATSACPGIIKSTAFVVRCNEGPGKLKNAKTGDILITYSTDIGWSPYFPMLGGVITELGGLISHGAVVAREYGLPCIIGAQNATRIFQTGDVIILNGNTGEVRKVEPATG